MRIIKQYIKSILLENKFDNLPLTEDLVEIMLDELLENPEKKITYKKVGMKYDEVLRAVNVFFNDGIKKRTSIYPRKILIYITKGEDYINNLKTLIQDCLDILEFENMFLKLMNDWDFIKKNNNTFRTDTGDITIKIIPDSILIYVFNEYEGSNFEDRIEMFNKDHSFKDPVKLFNEIEKNLNTI